MDKPTHKKRFSIKNLTKHFNKAGITRKRKILYGILGLFALGFVSVFILLAWVWFTLPDVDDPTKIYAAQSSIIYDRNGVVLYKIKGDEDRESVPFDKISKYAPLAAISIEDDEFYNHGGFDVAAILKAVCSEVHICSQARGGSTITQQYVKNTYLTNERTYTRKLKELMLAIKVEHRYTKDEILALYLNRIPYGSTIYGVEVASQKFFGKHAEELTVAESAVLASLPKSPTYYWPYGEHVYASINLDEQTILDKDYRSEADLVKANPDYIVRGLLGKTYTFGEGDQQRDIYVKGRVSFVLERMYELKHITKQELEDAQKETDVMEFVPLKNSLDKAPHFVTYVQQLLEEKYGPDKIQKGGLKITTTLDYEMQKEAEETVAKYGETNQNKYGANNASLLSMDPNTGQILAMVGSRDFNNEEIQGQNNLTTAPRQPGSSFKPYVYAAAFLKGYAPSTVIYDIKTKFGGWQPDNYDGKFKGPVTIRAALGSSLNIPAIKAGYLAGMENVMNLVRSMGIDIPVTEYDLPMAIGTVNVSALNMARGYSTFANGGYRVDPVSILKIQDVEGNIVEEYTPSKDRQQVLDPQVAYLINDVLTDKEARPAGMWRDNLTLPDQLSGAKTGTSNKPGADHKSILPSDVWTVGYVRNLVTAVWVGNTLGEALKPAASGVTTVTPMWHDFMVKAIKRVEPGEYNKPSNLKWVAISKRSGRLASKKTPAGDVVKAVFADFGVPKDYDDSYQVVKIDKVSGKLATEFTPEDAIEEKVFFVHHAVDPVWEKSVQAWAAASGQGGQIPTEYDDVHTAETMNEKPQITILSPKSSSIVSPPRINVSVDISSPNGVNRVDYYLDDVLLTTVSNAPFTGSLPLSAGLEDGSVHVVKAVVYDELLRSNQSSVKVKIGEDDTPPTVSFVYPKNNASLKAGALIQVQFQAYDGNGDISSMKYYLDGALYQNDIQYPFVWELKVPSEPGEHTLKVEAIDHAKNKSSDTITINVTEKNALNNNGFSGITSPTSNSFFTEGESVHITGSLSGSDAAMANQIRFLAKKSGQSAQVIASVSVDPNNSSYGVTWDTPPAGTYELYMQIVTDGNTISTDHVPIVVGG